MSEEDVVEFVNGLQPPTTLRSRITAAYRRPEHVSIAPLVEEARLATRPGPIVGIQRLVPGEGGVRLERLHIERALSINTAAAGGNASLMMVG